MDPAEFMHTSSNALEFMSPHIETLRRAGTIYDRAAALLSIIEEASLTLDHPAFWDMYDAHIAGDFALRDEILNSILGVS